MFWLPSLVGNATNGYPAPYYVASIVQMGDAEISEDAKLPGSKGSDDTERELTPFCAALDMQHKAIVFVDVVDSVRTMLRNEAGVIRRWRTFMQQVREQVIPDCSGVLVKSLGDGMLLTFEQPRDAVRAAEAMRGLMQQIDREARDAEPRERIPLRIGIHCGDVATDDLDIYGNSVNLAARLVTLCGSDEIVVSADMRDLLADGLDGAMEDLGECYVKSLDEPIRVYRVGRAGDAPVVPARAEYEAQMLPMIAVIPFEARSNDPGQLAIGELIADGVITQLSRMHQIKVVSRLSTTVFRGRNAGLDEIKSRLNATYVLFGSYALMGERLLVTAELVDARDGEVRWSERLAGDVGDLLQVESDLCGTIVKECYRTVLDTEVRLALTRPLPTLQSYSLLFGSITLMHRFSQRDFAKAGTALEVLAQRVPRNPTLLGWQARWHVFRTVQHWSTDVARDGRLAMDLARRALDIDSTSPQALAAMGSIHANMLGDLDSAQTCLDTLVRECPSDPMGWLLLGTIHAFRGEGAQAVEASARASELAPLDPMGFFRDSLTASSLLSAGDYAQAVMYARRSLAANRYHASTWRVLTMALALSGEVDEARKVAAQLLLDDPQFTVARFRSNTPCRDYPICDTLSRALGLAGIPAS